MWEVWGREEGQYELFLGSRKRSPEDDDAILGDEKTRKAGLVEVAISCYFGQCLSCDLVLWVLFSWKKEGRRCTRSRKALNLGEKA